MPTALSEDTFFIDHKSTGGLQMQLRQTVAASVLSGRLRVGDRMPSSRKLAAHLNISRITVTLAFQELVADGYLTSRDRSGYFVADTAPIASVPPSEDQSKAEVDWSSHLTRRYSGARLVEKTINWREFPFPFIYGQADPDLFNHSAWRSCAHRALGRRDFDALAGDYAAADDPELVDFIARQTLPRRGIAAQSEEILITLGAQNALWIVSQLLLKPGIKAAIENPGYPGIRDILAQTGCDVSPIDVDNDGLPPENLPDGTNVVFVTPSHHAPTTVTMPMSRRRELLAKAERDNFIVVEDDYEFEMSFLRPPRPALRSIDRGGRVIYVGSFSKSLFPGLRLGYLVGPSEFIKEARALRGTVLRHPPGHVQRTTAYFLSLGHYHALVRKMRDAFQIRREAMTRSIQELGLKTSHMSVYGGTSFWMEAPKHVDTSMLAKRLHSEGVLIEPGAPFFSDATPQHNFYRIAYSSIAPGKIHEGLSLIADAIYQQTKLDRTKD